MHKAITVRERIEACGCRLVFLPAYSPDFNPIEEAFSKLKTYLRRAKARTAGLSIVALRSPLNDYAHHCNPTVVP